MPANEPERLSALARYQLDLVGPVPALDRVANIAKGLFSAPIALVTIVDENHQRFVARYGLDRETTSREDSFCTHALVDNVDLVVPDTHEDARFRDNALVVGDPKVRYYAGSPLVNVEGYGLGTVCVLDIVPRPETDPVHLEILSMLAGIAMDVLEQRLHAVRLVNSLERVHQTVLAMESGPKS